MKIIECSLVVLLQLLCGTEHKVEYIRMSSVARLLWAEWFTRSLAVCHDEEMCEAPQSRLVSSLHNLPSANTLEPACDGFHNISRADNRVKQLRSSNIGHAILRMVQQHPGHVVPNCIREPLPFLKWSRSAKCNMQADWPETFAFPCSLLNSKPESLQGYVETHGASFGWEGKGECGGTTVTCKIIPPPLPRYMLNFTTALLMV